MLDQRLDRARSRQIGVGQIKQRHCTGQPKRGRRFGEYTRFNRIVVLHQLIGGPVEVYQAHALERSAQKFPKPALIAEPYIGRALRSGLASRPMMAPNAACGSWESPQGGATVLGFPTGSGPQRHMLHAHATHHAHTSGGHIHRGQLGSRSSP